MCDNNIKINLTGTVYSVQCIKFELQQGAATNKQIIKKRTNTDLCLAENSDTRGNGCRQGDITTDIKNSELLSQELNYRRLILLFIISCGYEANSAPCVEGIREQNAEAKRMK